MNAGKLCRARKEMKKVIMEHSTSVFKPFTPYLNQVREISQYDDKDEAFCWRFD